MQAGMFNDKSTHTERQQVLQTLMRKGALEVGEGIHSDKDINELLARSPAELRKFSQVG